MSNNLNPFTFWYMGQIFKVEYNNETDKLQKVEANPVTSIAKATNGRTFRTYVLDKTRGEFSYDMPKDDGNPEHTIKFK